METSHSVIILVNHTTDHSQSHCQYHFVHFKSFFNSLWTNHCQWNTPTDKRSWWCLLWRTEGLTVRPESQASVVDHDSIFKFLWRSARTLCVILRRNGAFRQHGRRTATQALKTVLQGLPRVYGVSMGPFGFEAGPAFLESSLEVLHQWIQ